MSAPSARFAFAGLLALAASTAGAAHAAIGPIQVVLASSPIDSADFKQVSVACPPGKIAFSGGVDVAGTVPILVHQSQPQGNPPTSWAVLAQERTPTAQSWSVTSWALCAAVAGYELVEGSSAFDSQNKTIEVDCPPGKAPIGGGGGIFFFSPDLALARLFPTATGWSARAFESEPTSANWILNVKASCAPVSDSVQFQASKANLTLDRDTLAVVCSSGRIALGGGGWIGGEFGWLSSSQPRTGGGGKPIGWEVDGRRLTTGWILTAAVLCHLPEVIFADGFESGNTGAWSATVP